MTTESDSGAWDAVDDVIDVQRASKPIRPT
jgi:hypothetical protein